MVDDCRISHPVSAVATGQQKHADADAQGLFSSCKSNALVTKPPSTQARS